MSVYITEDLEVLCDKLVVERTGNKEQNKLEYTYVILILIKNCYIMGLTKPIEQIFI